LGGERLAAGRINLRHPAFHYTSVATPCANVTGHLPGGVAGCRGLPALSTASRGKPVQRDSAAHLLFHYFYSLAVSNSYRNHDVAGAGCAVARFPRILGGRQAARSLHFIGLIVFTGFIVVHISLVIAHGLQREMAKIVLGDEAASHALAMTIGALAVAAVIAFHFWGTWYSLVSPSQAKRLLEIGVDPLRRLLFHHWDSRQEYRHISAYARINGKPPRNEIYERLAA